MAKSYNGHHCWNCWNVALWIDNEEPLYREALWCLNSPLANGRKPSLNIAATRMLDCLPPRTPDGARYTRTAVKAALAGLRE